MIEYLYFIFSLGNRFVKMKHLQQKLYIVVNVRLEVECSQLVM